MAISNLVLQYAVRQNVNLDQEALDENDVFAALDESQLEMNVVSSTDSATLNGKSVDLYGDVSDEKLEQLYSTSSSSASTTTKKKSYKNLSTKAIYNIKKLIAQLKDKTNLPKSNPTVPNPYVPNNNTVDNDNDNDLDNDIDNDNDNDIDNDLDSDLDNDMDEDGPDAPAFNPNHNIARGKSETIKVGATEIDVALSNNVDGKTGYFYKLSSVDGNKVDVTLTHMQNGRLLIKGDGVKVVACKDQADDIIVMGNNNYIDTNSGDDIVRVGGALDSQTVYYGDASQNKSNTIKTGSGNDYVMINGFNNNINMGGGDSDVIRYTTNTIDYMEGVYGNNSVTGQEYKYSTFEYNTDTFNNKIDGGSQGQYGDCKLLSLLNSLSNLEEYIKIKKSLYGYEVEFVKSEQIITVKNVDLKSLSDEGRLESDYNADGDIDMVAIEIAFRKILNEIGYNMNNDSDANSLGLSSNNWLISKYIFGTDAAGELRTEYSVTYSDGTTGTKKNTKIEEQFKDLFNAYLNGKISNIVLGTVHNVSVDGNSLGIYQDHAYSIRGGEIGKYLIVTNPWDGNDKIKLSWSDLLKYFDSINLYGDAYTYATEQEIFKDYLICNTSEIYDFYNNLSTSTSSSNNSNEKVLLAKYKSTTSDIVSEVAEIEAAIENAENIFMKKYEYLTE